MSEDQF